MPDLLGALAAGEPENRHDAPCPKQTTEDIAMDVEVNEWVLNHLPMTEEQKKKLRADLMADQTKKERKEKQTKSISQACKKWRLMEQRPARIKTQTGIKELTKQ